MAEQRREHKCPDHDFSSTDPEVQFCQFCGEELEPVFSDDELEEQEAERIRKEEEQQRIEKERYEARRLERKEREDKVQAEQDAYMQKLLDVNVVLNGGDKAMASATVPIEVFFGEEIRNQRPTHVLVVDRDDQVTSYSTDGGIRTLYEIKDAIKFLRFMRSGTHKLEVYVLCVPSGFATKRLNKYVLTTGGGEYRNGISVDEVVRYGVRDYRFEDDFCGMVVGYKEVQIDIPEQLFAHEPDTVWGKMVWNWVNGWYEQGPVDECHFGKRKIVAFTVKPFGWIFVKLIALVLMFFVSAYALVVFIFGFKVRNIMGMLIDTFRWQVEIEDHNRDLKYRVWKEIRSRRVKKEYVPGRTVYMPVTLIEVVGMALGVFILYGLVNYGALTFGAINAGLIGILLCGFIGWIWLNRLSGGRLNKWYDQFAVFLGRFRKAKETKVKPEPSLKTDRYWQYLGSFALDKAPDSIDLKHVPKAYGGPLRRVKQQTEIRFMALKARVCRPFQSK